MHSEGFWKSVTIKVVTRDNVLQAHRPAKDDDVARAIPVERRWPGLKDTPLIMAAEIPKSERPSFANHLALEAVLGMKDIIGLGAAYPEPFTDSASPYYPEFVALHPAPELPPDFAPGVDRIAGLAWRGPFSNLTRKVGEHYEFDLRHIEALDPREGFLTTGGYARLSRTATGLKTDYVELGGATVAPGDPGWDLVEKRFFAGMGTHTTVIEHLIQCHMCVGESHVIAAFEALPSRHPLRAFLQPFAIETLLVNGDNIDGLIKSEHSNVPSYSGFPLSAVDTVIRTVAKGFDLRRMDPEWRAADQGILDAGFVTIDAEVELFRHFKKMCTRYLAEVVKGVDTDTRAWCQLADTYIPNGVRGVAGIGDWADLTLEQVAHVLAVLTYTSSVTHHVMADTTRDYMMSFQIMPPAVAADGFPTRGQVLEKMNSITIAGILRYRLMDDHVELPEGSAQSIWAEFQGALRGIQERIDNGPADQRRYQILPSKIPSSIHA